MELDHNQDNTSFLARPRRLSLRWRCSIVRLLFYWFLVSCFGASGSATADFPRGRDGIRRTCRDLGKRETHNREAIYRRADSQRAGPGIKGSGNRETFRGFLTVEREHSRWPKTTVIRKVVSSFTFRSSNRRRSQPSRA